MENKNREKRWTLPETITGWVLLIFGVFALLGGFMGIIGLDTFTLISVSAVNNGILHFVGVFQKWQIFPYYAIVSRTLMGGGLLWLAASDVESDKLIAGAIFEFAGVIILIMSLLLDKRKRRVKESMM